MRMNMCDFIDNLNPNDIDSFRASNDQLKFVMTMKNGEKIEIPIGTGFGNFYFYRLIEKISGEKSVKVVFPDINGYISAANNAMIGHNIRNILLDIGSNAKVSDIRKIMLDGFKHKNLFTLAEKEGNFKKYVLLAVKLYDELDGDVNIIYTNKFRQRVLKRMW